MMYTCKPWKVKQRNIIKYKVLKRTFFFIVRTKHKLFQLYFSIFYFPFFLKTSLWLWNNSHSHLKNFPHFKFIFLLRRRTIEQPALLYEKKKSFDTEKKMQYTRLKHLEKKKNASWFLKKLKLFISAHYYFLQFF